MSSPTSSAVSSFWGAIVYKWGAPNGMRFASISSEEHDFSSEAGNLEDLDCRLKRHSRDDGDSVSIVCRVCTGVEEKRRSSVINEMEKNFEVFLGNHQDEENALMEICDLFPEQMEPYVPPVLSPTNPDVATTSGKSKKTANKSNKPKRGRTANSKGSEPKRRCSLEQFDVPTDDDVRKQLSELIKEVKANSKSLKKIEHQVYDCEKVYRYAKDIKATLAQMSSVHCEMFDKIWGAVAEKKPTSLGVKTSAPMAGSSKSDVTPRKNFQPFRSAKAVKQFFDKNVDGYEERVQMLKEHLNAKTMGHTVPADFAKHSLKAVFPEYWLGSMRWSPKRALNVGMVSAPPAFKRFFEDYIRERFPTKKKYDDVLDSLDVHLSNTRSKLRKSGQLVEFSSEAFNSDRD